MIDNAIATASDVLGDDPIVTEVRASREAIFARAGHDLQELGRQLQVRQAAAGRAGVTLPSVPPDGDRDAA